jgi:mxaK protein
MQINGWQSAVVGLSRAEPPAAHGVPHQIAAAMRHLKGALLWVVFCGSALALVVSAGLLLSTGLTNAVIRDLRAGKDVPVDAAGASAARLEARAAFLLTRDRIDEAQPLLDQASRRAGDAVQVRMLYNMANARLRAAIKAIEQGKFDKAIPLVALAKAEYRQALRLAPLNWDAKHNIDVAMRLVRDLPRPEGEDQAQPETTPSKLWTDLPGIPKGLP